ALVVELHQVLRCRGVISGMCVCNHSLDGDAGHVTPVFSAISGRVFAALAAANAAVFLAWQAAAAADLAAIAKAGDDVPQGRSDARSSSISRSTPLREQNSLPAPRRPQSLMPRESNKVCTGL